MRRGAGSADKSAALKMSYSRFIKRLAWLIKLMFATAQLSYYGVFNFTTKVVEVSLNSLKAG